MQSQKRVILYKKMGLDTFFSLLFVCFIENKSKMLKKMKMNQLRYKNNTN